MSKSASLPPLGLDLASGVLGAVGLALFILPVLALPIIGAGIAAGLIAVTTARRTTGAGMRLAMAGLLFCGLSLTVVSAIGLAQNGYFAPRRVFPELRSHRGRPFVPAPAPPRSAPLQRRSSVSTAPGRVFPGVAGEWPGRSSKLNRLK